MIPQHDLLLLLLLFITYQRNSNDGEWLSCVVLADQMLHVADRWDKCESHWMLYGVSVPSFCSRGWTSYRMNSLKRCPSDLLCLLVLTPSPPSWTMTVPSTSRWQCITQLETTQIVQTFANTGKNLRAGKLTYSCTAASVLTIDWEYTYLGQ